MSHPTHIPNLIDGAVSVSSLPQKFESHFLKPDTQRKIEDACSISTDFERHIQRTKMAHPALASQMRLEMSLALKSANPTNALPRSVHTLLGTEDYIAFDAFRDRFPSEQVSEHEGVRAKLMQAHLQQ
eukprot:gnl/Dysnectes_brevis/906_a1007_4810.p1 GENE.gnl/Dysnectes_brevis/906_a1007_4810~~gnl/Dysnectes_brevis/906_a1007_4810.p1  ORF type:complete len:138 (-),score=16.60 gnl/Dysnectes_brevis/906_a1007_4810:34-417(-)